MEKEFKEAIVFIIVIYIGFVVGFTVYDRCHSIFSCIHYTKYTDWWECKALHMVTCMVSGLLTMAILGYVISKFNK